MSMQLTNLDELVLSICNQKAKKYITEAIVSYRSAAYRSAIILTWIAVCVDIIEKILELSQKGDKAAEEIIQQLRKIENNDYLGRMNFEKSILDFACERLELISVIEKSHFEKLKSDRNICAHPNYLEEDDGSYVVPELVRGYIVQACQYLLIHKPVRGKYVIDRIYNLINEKSFPEDNDQAYNILKSDYNLGRVKDSVIRNLIKLIFKRIFKNIEPIDQQLFERLCASVNALYRINTTIFNETIKEIFSSFVGESENQIFYRTFPLILYCGMLADKLGDPEILRLKQTIKTLTKEDLCKYLVPVVANNIHWINETLIKRLDEMNSEEIVYVVQKVPCSLLKKYAIEIFVKSSTFSETGLLGNKILLPHIKYFTKNDLEILFAGIKENKSYKHNQILESTHIDNILCQIFNETKYIQEIESLVFVEFYQNIANDYGSNLECFKKILISESLIECDDDQQFESNSMSQDFPF